MPGRKVGMGAPRKTVVDSNATARKRGVQVALGVGARGRGLPACGGEGATASTLVDMNAGATLACGVSVASALPRSSISRGRSFGLRGGATRRLTGRRNLRKRVVNIRTRKSSQTRQGEQAGQGPATRALSARPLRLDFVHACTHPRCSQWGGDRPHGFFCSGCAQSALALKLSGPRPLPITAHVYQDVEEPPM